MTAFGSGWAEMGRPIAGVLGGMGPAATADLYRKIIEVTPAERDQDHVHVVIWADPSVPDRSASLLGQGADPRPWLINGARALEAAGADFLAIPCNTAHAMIADIARAVSIPVLSMVEETVEVLRACVPRVRSAAVLATEGTLRARLYQPLLTRAGIDVVEPDPDRQRALTALIARVKAGRAGADASAELARLVDSMPGVDAFIAACTELPLLLPLPESATGRPRRVVDTSAALAEAVVRTALAMRTG